MNPKTPEQWQEAVDAAYACLVLDAAVGYGLVERERIGGVNDGERIAFSGVNTDRCLELLERGAELGYTPTDDAGERFVRELREA